VIEDRYLMLDESQSPLGIAGAHPFKGDDPGYHMSVEGQHCIAHNYLERMHRDYAI
jgi:hypothetical protein